MARPQISTPAAILLAGAMIALSLFLGLFVGLRDPAPIGAATTPARPIGSTPGAAAARRAAPTLAAAGREQVTREVSAALEAQRSALHEKCWKPRADAGPSPAPVKLFFQFGIGADGLQRSRGVMEARRMGNPEVTRCILETLGPIRVSPPGAEVSVEVPFGLP